MNSSKIVLVFQKKTESGLTCKIKKNIKVGKKKSIKWKKDLCEYCPNTVSIKSLSLNQQYNFKIYRSQIWNYSYF